MARRVWLTAVVVVVIGSVGCGSSDSGERGGGGAADMDDMLARVEQQRAAAAPASAPASSTPAGAAAPPVQPGAAAQSATPAASSAPDPSLQSKRGFGLEDWSNEAAYVLVKADIAKAADALAAHWEGGVVKDVLGKPVNEQRAATVIWQLIGHPWSIFPCENSDLEELAPALSRTADVLVFWQNDFNGWAGIELYRGGAQVEAVHWGLAEDGLGEDADPGRWDANGQFVRTYEGISMTDAFRFRSKLRKVSADELNEGDEFINSFMRHHDAYLPDADQMPWFDYDTKLISSPLGAAVFTGVHAVDLPAK